ncbi:MAG: AAA family ATPase [Bacteroidales bacterium]|nr:AAA family ATPase [Bacteroidales bacterium]
MITKELKQKIVQAMQSQRPMFGGSDSKYAKWLGISGSQYSRVKNGDFEQVLSDTNWLSIARQLEVNMGNAPEWKTARTPVYEFVNAQLEICQNEALSSLLCDLSDIGKTWTAKVYAKTHKNVAYIDCSLAKGKTQLIRSIAKAFGLDNSGRLNDVEANTIYYLKQLEKPLIILDEAGDMHYEAWLEVKALWNATEGACGWYMMGADGLKAKIQRSIDNKKVGYTEIFSRFGKRYGKLIAEGEAGKEMMKTTAAMIIKANGGEDVNQLLRKTMGDDGMPSLRRIYKELRKRA